MVTLVEFGILLVVLLLLIGVYILIKSIKPLIINTIVGLLVLVLAGVLGFGVEITPVVVLLVAFGGVPAAVLILILAYLGIFFHPAFLLL